MEYLDVLTENGELTGQSVPRSEAHAKGLWHRAAHIWIVNSRGELLLQKRSMLKESHPGQWDISAAGHLSAGDSVVDGAVREIKEEIGVEITADELIPLGVVKVARVLNNGAYLNNQFDNIFLLKKDLDISTIKIQESEVDEVKFIPWQELKQMADTKDQSLVMHEEEFELLFKYLETFK